MLTEGLLKVVGGFKYSYNLKSLAVSIDMELDKLDPVNATKSMFCAIH